MKGIVHNKTRTAYTEEKKEKKRLCSCQL